MMSDRRFFNFQTMTLDNLDIMLLYSCKYHFSISLLKIWNELIDEFNFLTDFYSDYVEPTKEINELLEYMDKLQELAAVQPNFIRGIKRWLLVCSENFFNFKKRIQKAILLHEVGHIIVNEYDIFKELRSQCDDVEPLFNNFCSNITRNGKYFLKTENLLREFFGFYVFGVLHIPGEIYSNLWVKINCNEYFELLIENQFNNYINLNKKIRENIKNRLLKYVLIYLVLRLQALTMLLENNNQLCKDIINYKDKILTELKTLLSEKEYFLMLELFESIKNICYFPDEVNVEYFNLFNKYITSLKIQPQDFLSYP